MKIYIIIFCLFLSVHAYSQSGTVKDTSKLLIRDASVPPTKSLVILDDTIYVGSLDSIDLNSIVKVDILHGINATALYGSRAEQGVIIITTKNHTQSIPKKVSETSIHSFQERSLAYLIKDEPLYVIDDKYLNEIPKDIDPVNILTLDVLKDNTAIAKYGDKAKNGAVIIITKTYAIASYQKKFSGFSKRYVNYLRENKNNDSYCIYVLDGVPVVGKSYEVIKKLFELSSNKIKSVDCMENPYLNGNNNKEIVAIVTKKN